MEQTSKKAVVYCRVSTKEQVDEGNSLESQRKHCEHYALLHGYEIAEVFIEKGESAKNSLRPELQRMLKYCGVKAHNINAVIAYKLDRISRNTDDYSEIRILLKRYGVEVKSTTEFFEDTPAGKFMENMLANVAQFDNDVRTERCIGGMKDAMREGRYVWNAPVGYMNFLIAKKSNIVPNEYAPLVKSAFEEVARNTSPIDEIRRRMMKAGLVTKKGRYLSKSAFMTMLRNEVYAGWIRKFGERHRGLYEPIVSEELYAQVQRVLRLRGHKTIQYKLENPDFPLRRFLTDGNGRKLTGAWAKGRNKIYPYYRYENPVKSYRKADVENAFKRLLDSIEFSEQHYDALYKKIAEQLTRNTEEQTRDKKLAERRIDDLKNKQTVIIERNIEGYISNELMQQQLSIIERELVGCYAVCINLTNKNVTLEPLLDEVKAYLRKPSETWEKAPFVSKLRLQWFTFPQGIIFDGVNCRTNEISPIFKAKSVFILPKNFKVDFASKTLNQIPNKPLTRRQRLAEIANPKIRYDFGAGEYWNEIGNDIVDLSRILKPVEDSSPTKIIDDT